MVAEDALFARLGLPAGASPADALGALLDRIEALERRLGPEHTCVPDDPQMRAFLNFGRDYQPPSPDDEQRLWERGAPELLVGRD